VTNEGIIGLILAGAAPFLVRITNAIPLFMGAAIAVCVICGGLVGLGLEPATTALLQGTVALVVGISTDGFLLWRRHHANPTILRPELALGGGRIAMNFGDALRHRDLTTAQRVRLQRFRSEALRIGRPSRALRAAEHASTAQYQNCVTIWLGQPRVFIVIDSANRWVAIDEGASCSQAWAHDNGPNSYGRKAAIERFKRGNPPSGFYYPRGGIAKFIDSGILDWERFGFLKYQCQFDRNEIFISETNHSYILGYFPQDTKKRVGQVWILHKDGRAQALTRGDVDTPVCVDNSVGKHP
jgi:hypothetical protein